MAKYEYAALNAQGQESRGVIDAASTNEAVATLRKSGFFPTSVTEAGKGGGTAVAVKVATPVAVAGTPVAVVGKAKAKPKAGGSKFFERKTVDGKVLMIFTRQLATLIDAGLPLLRGLEVLGKQEKDPVLKKIIFSISDSVQSGSTFSESLGHSPHVFSKLFVNMVKAGELGGVLELVLNRLAEFQEKAQKLRNKVKSAMTYPLVVLTIAMLILVFLLAFIVPSFEKLFKDRLKKTGN